MVLSSASSSSSRSSPVPFFLHLFLISHACFLSSFQPCLAILLSVSPPFLSSPPWLSFLHSPCLPLPPFFSPARPLNSLSPLIMGTVNPSVVGAQSHRALWSFAWNQHSDCHSGRSSVWCLCAGCWGRRAPPPSPTYPEMHRHKFRQVLSSV